MIMEPYYEKFPDVLKNALKENKVTFPTLLNPQNKNSYMNLYPHNPFGKREKRIH